MLQTGRWKAFLWHGNITCQMNLARVRFGVLGVVQGLAVTRLMVLGMPVGAHMAMHIHKAGADPHKCDVDSVILLINCFIVAGVDTHIDLRAPRRLFNLPQWNLK